MLNPGNQPRELSPTELAQAQAHANPPVGRAYPAHGHALPEAPHAPQEASNPPTPPQGPQAPSRPLLAALAPSPGQPEPFTLSDGRVLMLRKPPRATKLVIVKALGPHSSNDVYRVYCEAVSYISHMDGIGQRLPQTMKEFDDLITLVGDDIEALVTRVLYEGVGNGGGSMSAEETNKAFQEAVKNG